MIKVIEIGLPCTPAKHIRATLLKTIKLLVTYGGGMGGASRVLHCTKMDVTDESFYTVTLLTGETRRINPAYIVEESYPEVIEVLTDITEHVNHRSKECERAYQTRFIELPYGSIHKRVGHYISDSDMKDAKIILNFTEKM